MEPSTHRSNTVRRWSLLLAGYGLNCARLANWGEPERAPHKPPNLSHRQYFRLYGMYIYSTIYMYGTSVTRAPLHRLCIYRAGRMQSFVLHYTETSSARRFELHRLYGTGSHAIFCAEKSAPKNNCDSML